MISLAGCKGYTLLEVLIVVAILSVVLVPVSVFFQEYIRKLSSEDLLINKQLAQNVMEMMLKSKSYTDRDTVIVVNNKSYCLNVKSRLENNLILLNVSSNRQELNDKPFILQRYVYQRENKTQ